MFTKRGHLPVDDLHEIYFEVHGNGQGETVLFLHGGPGLGTSHRDLSFFDLEQTQVILLDQRGCGQSRPLGTLKNNTPKHLVADIASLLDHLGVERVILFGGSWGSTLALLFAIAHPQRVSGMVLRGVFLASLEERRFFERGELQNLYPKAWARYAGKVPTEQRSEVSAFYYQKILHGTAEEQKEYAYELAVYGMSISPFPLTIAEIDQVLQGRDYTSRGIILAQYSTHNFFMPDRFIWDQLPVLAKIPVHIVHGYSDHITLVKYAEQLAAQLPAAELYLIKGGHSPFEESLQKQLIDCVKQLLF
ncbi:MAG: alpha/beta fold hydrolase [Bacteroidota bacterium]